MDERSPSRGGALRDWIERQLAYSQERVESYHRGVADALLEVRRGMVLEPGRGIEAVGPLDEPAGM